MNTNIGVKLEEKHRELLDKVVENRGESLSSFVRRAILKELAELSYLPDEEKKALGIEGGRESDR